MFIWVAVVNGLLWGVGVSVLLLVLMRHTAQTDALLQELEDKARQEDS